VALLALVWHAAPVQIAWFRHRLQQLHLNMQFLKCKLTPSFGPTVRLPATGGRGLYRLLYPRSSIHGFNSCSNTSFWTSAEVQQAGPQPSEGVHTLLQLLLCWLLYKFEAGLCCRLVHILC
jgi:hypothetical protein